MKRWTEAEPRDSNITDYEQFNKEYNAQKSSLNGGIDRNQIAQSLVTKAMLKDYAMHRVYLNEHGEFPDTSVINQFSDTGTTTNTEGHFRGLTYTTYNGGWIPIVEQDYTGLKDGMVYMEFNAHLHMEVEFSMTAGNTINNKDVQLAITWNGTPILNTFKYTLGFQTIRLFANTFSPAGTGRLVIKARMVPKAATDYIHIVQMHFWGMKTLLIGRWR
jgi:hypothetical protein